MFYVYFEGLSLERDVQLNGVLCLISIRFTENLCAIHSKYSIVFHIYQKRKITVVIKKFSRAHRSDKGFVTIVLQSYMKSELVG